MGPNQGFHFDNSHASLLLRGAVSLNYAGVVRRWEDGEIGYFGFRFTSDASGTTETFYGWAELLLEGAARDSYTIGRAWYNDVAGESIQVGQVPEPAGAGLGLGVLALGAAGLRRTRATRRHQSGK